jgi:hypothetical protein
MSSREIYVVESHEQVLELWRDQSACSQQILHLDFHCDLRGTLINRATKRAHRIWDRFPKLDEGNFLTHAIFGGVVNGIRWVHDNPGGRNYDLWSVKYESDLSSLPQRCLIALRRDQGKPINYQVIHCHDWAGTGPDEVLDIDWDFFASVEYPLPSIPRRVAAFFSRDFAHIPRQTYVCYSPGYCHSTRALFRDFIAELATRFDARVVNVPQRSTVRSCQGYKGNLASLPAYQWARDTYHRAGLALRRRGIY